MDYLVLPHNHQHPSQKRRGYLHQQRWCRNVPNASEGKEGGQHRRWPSLALIVCLTLWGMYWLRILVAYRYEPNYCRDQKFTKASSRLPKNEWTARTPLGEGNAITNCPTVWSIHQQCQWATLIFRMDCPKLYLLFGRQDKRLLQSTENGTERCNLVPNWYPNWFLSKSYSSLEALGNQGLLLSTLGHTRTQAHTRTSTHAQNV